MDFWQDRPRFLEKTIYKAFFMYTLYATAGSGNCYKPFLAMRQLGLDFEVVEVNVLSAAHQSAAYLALNPLGKVPLLQWPGGHRLAESAAMLWMLCENTPLMPAAAADRAQALQWMLFEQLRLEPNIAPARFLTTIAPERGAGREADIAAWQTKARAGLAHLARHLAAQAQAQPDAPFVVAGRYSLADIALYGYVHVCAEAGIALAEEFPAIERWVRAVAATPGYVPMARMCEGARVFA